MYKVNKDLAAGVYFSYGFGQLASGICDGVPVCTRERERHPRRRPGSVHFNQVKSPLVPWAGRRPRLGARIR